MSAPTGKELRDLDCWIAEHVFGDKPDPSKTIPFSSEQYCHPNYTTDPAAAMLVLEKILLRGWTITELCHHDDAGFAIEATVGNRTEEAWGETLPLAICRFAKKAFEK